LGDEAVLEGLAEYGLAQGMRSKEVGTDSRENLIS